MTGYKGNTSFREWIAILEAIMRDWDSRHGNLPYALPLRRSTGLDCWRDSYDDSMTPQEAFDEDQHCWK